MSDIPVIFAVELRRLPRAAVFLSAASTAQTQQYAVAGWTVTAAEGFSATGAIDLAAVPAQQKPDADIAAPTLLSCEAPRLKPDTARRIAAWKPAIVKINCAFHGVADARDLAASLRDAGYQVLAAQWRDDNSFGLRAVTAFGSLEPNDEPEWDRTDLIAVVDDALRESLLAVGRLYAEEERRILELRVGNAVRSDTIARLEDALVARQPSALFKLRPS